MSNKFTKQWILALGLALTLIASATNTFASSYNQYEVRHAKLLYNQRKPSIPALKIAAATGDAESQFLLAEELRGPTQIMNPEALRWYEKSALQGDMYAMFRLSNKQYDLCIVINSCSQGSRSPAEWKKQLISIAEKKTAEGDSEAMAILYLISGDLKWLKNSANAGNPESQWLLANKYKEGNGFFWPGQRDKEIENQLKLSAKAMFPRAIIEYAALLGRRGESDKGRQWYLKAVELSYAIAVSSYAYLLETGDTYNIQKDPVQAYALNTILLELDGGGGLDMGAKHSIEELKKQLSLSEIKHALDYAEQWKQQHPPLSFYRIKLGM